MRTGTSVSLRLAQFTLAAVLGLLSTGSVLRAQVGTPGTFIGTVRDATNSSVSGAKVTAMNLATGLVTSTTTSDTGLYRIPELPPGHYRLEVSMTGFRTELHNDVELTVSQTQELNFSLQIGATNETVTVTGEAPLVDTSSSTVSSLVNEQQVQNLPLNGRSYDNLITLTPGISNSNAAWGPGNSANRGTTAIFEIGGTRPTMTKLVVDGSQFSGGGAQNTNLSTASGKLLGVDSLRNSPSRATQGMRASASLRVDRSISLLAQEVMRFTAPHMTTCGATYLMPAIFSQRRRHTCCETTSAALLADRS